MADRCVTVSSAGKTFSFTGWKVGSLTCSSCCGLGLCAPGAAGED